MGSIFLTIFVFFYTFIAQPVGVVGSSMTPNFKNGDSYTVNKFDANYNRGDVVVFMDPISRDEKYLKRLVALPGDKIEVKSGKFYLNDKEDNEPYLPSDSYTDQGAFLQDGMQYTLKDDEYFILGDNRAHSSDSRSWGPISKKDIVGKIWFKYKSSEK